MVDINLTLQYKEKLIIVSIHHFGCDILRASKKEKTELVVPSTK